MLELVSLLWAVSAAHSSMKSKREWRISDLNSYRVILINARYFLRAGIVESGETFPTKRRLANYLIGVLDTRIEEIDALIRLNPVILGKIKK